MFIFALSITRKTNNMIAKSLIAKLKKNNIEFNIVDINGYNKEILFSINNMSFSADFNDSIDNEVLSFARDIWYNSASQEMERRYFSNFNQLLKYATE